MDPGNFWGVFSSLFLASYTKRLGSYFGCVINRVILGKEIIRFVGTLANQNHQMDTHAILAQGKTVTVVHRIYSSIDVRQTAAFIG